MDKDTSDLQIKTYYEEALQLIIKCGPLFREGFDKAKKDVIVKSDYYDLVTVFDRQIEKRLAEGLKAAFPESIIMGEEETYATGSVLELTDAPTWIIDPIDGTTNYVHKIPYCGISVGLSINKELVAGIVYNPTANELYSAYRGHGAYLNGEPINVSITKKMSNAVVAHEITLINEPAWRDKNIKRLYKLGSQATGTRCFATAAISLCYLAKGALDVYHVDDLKPWDIAAGALIVREAGGFVYNTNGGEFDIMKPNVVCAATQPLALEALQLIKEADEISEYTFK